LVTKQQNRVKVERDPKRTRAKILRAATVLFAAKGPDATRVDEIAARAGVNKRMLYHYFGSKTELYQSVLKDTFSRMDQISDEIFHNSKSAAELVDAIFREYFGFLQQNPEYIALMNWENSNQAKYMKSVVSFSPAKKYVDVLHQALERERKNSNIPANINIKYLIMTCMTLCSDYFTNSPTLSAAFDIDMSDPVHMNEWLEHVRTLVVNGVFKAGTSGNHSVPSMHTKSSAAAQCDRVEM
jgi:TetR/AcrR family transcriptional regulator